MHRSTVHGSMATSLRNRGLSPAGTNWAKSRTKRQASSATERILPPKTNIVGTFSDSVETATPNGTSVVDAGCPSGNVTLPGGYFAGGTQWIYAGSINVLGKIGANKGGAVVAEAGFGETNYNYVQELRNGEGNCLDVGRQGTDTNSDLGLSAASILE